MLSHFFHFTKIRFLIKWQRGSDDLVAQLPMPGINQLLVMFLGEASSGRHVGHQHRSPLERGKGDLLPRGDPTSVSRCELAKALWRIAFSLQFWTSNLNLLLSYPVLAVKLSYETTA